MLILQEHHHNYIINIKNKQEEKSIATFQKPPGSNYAGGAPRRPYQGNRFRPRKKENEHYINEDIEAPEVRLVGDNVESGVYSIEKARQLAESLNLDLVAISPNVDPPVCKIVDYKKFLYDKKKKEKEVKQNTAKSVMKEIRFGPNTDDHDFEFKVKHARKFLEEGAKVRAYVMFRGRAIAYKEQGEILLLRFAQELADSGKVELLPKLEGNRMFLNLAPLPKKK